MKRLNFSLHNYNSYGIKATCAEAVFPESVDEIMLFLKDKRPYFIIGSGNNIILSKDCYSERFLIFNNCFNDFEITKDYVLKAKAGARLEQLSEYCAEKELSGFESFYDIPGTIAGAVVMNAGDAAMEIKDSLTQVTLLNKSTLETVIKKVHELDFSYRNSIFQTDTDWLLLEAWFQLSPSTKEKVLELMKSIKEKRWAKQPREMRNAGSVFKRPEGFYVGKHIEDLGLKGYTIGDASISEKHAGFIVNKGSASGTDIIQLIEHVQEEVKKAYGIELELEQRII